MPRRRRRKNDVDKVYWELLPLLSGYARVSIEGNNIVLDTSDLQTLWFRLENLCEEIVVGNYHRISIGEDYYVIELFCASKKMKIIVKTSDLPNLLALTPVFLLYDKKACIKGLKSRANVL